MAVDITYLGHSGFLVRSGGTVVAIDPFLTGNPVADRGAGDIECTHIIATHGHADHFGDVPSIAKRTGATVFAAYEICEFLGEQGHGATEPMNPGGRVETAFGFVALTPAFHSSSFEGRYMGMPCGVVLRLGGTTIYHTGDTALFDGIRLVGELYKPDIAMICVGDRFTMGPEHGSIAAEWTGARHVIPIHYATWPLLASDISAFAPTGATVKAMRPGETWSGAGPAQKKS